MAGEATPAQIGAFLVALRIKGETADEIAGCAEAMREHVLVVRPARTDLVDTAGTGGDGARTFNISTAAALVAAAAGAGVAKHGNRAVSSSSGSADVLEALGFNLELPPETIARSIDELGFGFLFAPTHHPAMRHAAPVRRDLATRTVFNVLGPLTNPAGARAQVVGVYAPELVPTIADVLARLGAERAFVVHGAAGVDELSPAGPNLVCEVANGQVRRREIDPLDLGIDRCAPEELGGGDPADNAETIRRIFSGAEGGKRDAVLLNAAGAIAAGGLATRPRRRRRARPRSDRLRSGRRAARGADRVLAGAGGDGVRFRDALAQPGLSAIAEIKRRSPSAGDLRPDADPGALAARVRAGGSRGGFRARRRTLRGLGRRPAGSAGRSVAPAPREGVLPRPGRAGRAETERRGRRPLAVARPRRRARRTADDVRHASSGSTLSSRPTTQTSSSGRSPSARTRSGSTPATSRPSTSTGTRNSTSSPKRLCNTVLLSRKGSWLPRAGSSRALRLRLQSSPGRTPCSSGRR